MHVYVRVSLEFSSKQSAGPYSIESNSVLIQGLHQSETFILVVEFTQATCFNLV